MNKININDLYPIEKQLSVLKRLNYREDLIQRYGDLLEKNKFYYSVKSDMQINELKKTNDFYHRLYRLVCKITRTTPNFGDFVKAVDDSKNDRHFTSKIRYMTKNLPRIRNYTGQRFSYTDFINEHITQKSKIKRILDVGCGDGRKLKFLTKLFNIEKDNAICADIPEWFSYNKDNRDKNITFMEIPEKGEIKLNKKVQLVTMYHVIHHMSYSKKDYVERLKSIYNLMSKDGYLVIAEHNHVDAFDCYLQDYEHALYELYNRNFVDKFYSKYLNFMEVILLMEEVGFTLESINTGYHDEIKQELLPTRTHIYIFRK